ncbi:MAG: enediyne biosynthesis protein UnbU [Knoellia sp.]
MSPLQSPVLPAANDDTDVSRDTSAPAPAEPNPAPATKPAPDPRRTALLRFGISISVLTIIGHILLGFEPAPIVPLLALPLAYAVALGLEFLDARAHDRVPEYEGSRSNLVYFLLPPHIAALACSMLLYADHTRPYLFAVVVAVASKYLIRLRWRGKLKHFLNPSNFGIAVTLLLMPTVGFVPPYQFLNNIDQPFDVLIPLGVLMAGTMLNAGLTKRMPLILAWVGGYVLQAIVRAVFFGDNIWAPIGMMTGVAFVLFTNYMITDPATTPMRPSRQVVFGLTAATVYGILIVAQVSYAIFFCLIITCALRGLTMWVAERRGRSTAPTSTVLPGLEAHHVGA